MPALWMANELGSSDQLHRIVIMKAYHEDLIPPVIKVFVSGNCGYVWDAEEFKNQNEVNALPLELNADEVTHAKRKGWISLHTSTPRAAVRKSEPTADVAPDSGVQALAQNGPGPNKRRRKDTIPAWEAYYAYHESCDPRDSLGLYKDFITATAVRNTLPAQQQSKTDKATAAANISLQDAGEPHWKAALGDPGIVLQLPLTAQQARLQRAGLMKMLATSVEQRPTKPPTAQQQQQLTDTKSEGQHQQEHSSTQTPGKQSNPQHSGQKERGKGGASSVHGCSGVGVEAGAEEEEFVSWSYPVTDGERLRCAVFRDLHDKGFTMTGGAKFGADMLAYPGDPSLYHAQFTVRMVAHDAPLNPMLLKATARGSHAARKHSLLATIDVSQAIPSLSDTELVPVYISIAPETGFGSK